LTPGIEPESFSGLFTVAQDLPYLQGHFPGLPLVPAVILLEISQEFLRASLDRPGLRARRARHCKFKGMVTPGETYRLSAVSPKSGSWLVTWTKKAAGTGSDGPIVELSFEAD
jgi:3-hydroxymyristoyl/3-hydroxydecanoyl-(acyl carrier protein) dehydratase